MGIKMRELVEHLFRTTVRGGREDQGHDGETLWECLEVVGFHGGRFETLLQDLAQASTEEIVSAIEHMRDGCASLTTTEITLINEGLPILRRRLDASPKTTTPTATEPANTHA